MWLCMVFSFMYFHLFILLMLKTILNPKGEISLCLHSIYTLNMESSGLNVPGRRTIHFNFQNFYRDIDICLSSNVVEIVRNSENMIWDSILYSCDVLLLLECYKIRYREKCVENNLFNFRYLKLIQNKDKMWNGEVKHEVKLLTLANYNNIIKYYNNREHSLFCFIIIWPTWNVWATQLENQKPSHKCTISRDLSLAEWPKRSFPQTSNQCSYFEYGKESTRCCSENALER